MRPEPTPVDFSSSGRSDPHKPEVYPIPSSPSDAAQSAIVPASEEEAEVLHTSIKAGSVAQIVVAVIAVVGLIYFLKLVMVTTLTALLLAFILEPLVSGLNRGANSSVSGSVPRSGADARTGGSFELFLLPACARLRHEIPEIFRPNTGYFSQTEDRNKKDRR